MYCGAVRNICAVRHGCMIANRYVAADAGKTAYSRTGANHTVGVNQGVIPYRCITVDFRSGIQQNTVSDRCTILMQAFCSTTQPHPILECGLI